MLSAQFCIFREMSFHLCPVKKMVYLFFVVDLWGLFTYSGYEPLIRYMVYKYVFPFHRLPFHCCVFWCTEVSNFDVIQFICFYFCFLCFWCHVQETVATLNVIKYLLLLYLKSTYVVSLYFCNYCLVCFTTWFTICIFSLTIYQIKLTKYIKFLYFIKIMNSLYSWEGKLLPVIIKLTLIFSFYCCA